MSSQLARLLSCDLNENNLPVRAEQMRARLRAYPLMIGAQVLVALMLAVLVWDVVAHRVLLVWLGVLFVELAIEFFYASRDVVKLDTLDECRRWRSRLLVSVSLAGLIWGAGGIFLFVPDNFTYQVILICVYLGVSAGAATTNPVFAPSLYIYISLLMLPLVLINALVGDHDHFMLAGLLVVYWGFLLKSGRELAKIFELSLRRAIENEYLIEQLIKEKQRAELANEMKARFLAAASHDLRQPLHALAMLIGALKGYVQGEHGCKLQEKVEHSVEVLGGMLDTLLDVARLDAGVITPNYELFAIQPLLERLRDEYKLFSDKQGLRLEVSRFDGMVCSDPMLLEIVLRNLLSNALRHTVHGEVSLTCQPVEQGLQLSVCDTGVGISAEHLPHIFEAYFQIGNRQRDRRKGLGLGLVIVKRLANLLDYSLQVSSIVDEGTCFTLVIPRDDSLRCCEKSVLSKIDDAALSRAAGQPGFLHSGSWSASDDMIAAKQEQEHLSGGKV